MLRHVAAKTLEGYAELGWAAQVHVADVLSWAGNAWHTREFSAGLFSHGFSDQRAPTD